MAAVALDPALVGLTRDVLTLPCPPERLPGRVAAINALFPAAVVQFMSIAPGESMQPFAQAVAGLAGPAGAHKSTAVASDIDASLVDAEEQPLRADLPGLMTALSRFTELFYVTSRREWTARVGNPQPFMVEDAAGHLVANRDRTQCMLKDRGFPEAIPDRVLMGYGHYRRCHAGKGAAIREILRRCPHVRTIAFQDDQPDDIASVLRAVFELLLAGRITHAIICHRTAG